MKQITIVVIGTILISCASTNLAGQVSQSDSNLLIHLNRNINAIEEIQLEWKQQKGNIFGLSQGYCFLNKVDKNSASKVFELFVFNDLIKSDVSHKFLIRNVSCFTDDQLMKIRGRLNSEIESKDFFYHSLVSTFNLYSQIPYLKDHISDDLFYIISEDINNGYISEKSKEQLKNYSTLANLGFEGHEVKVISFVKEMYDKVVENELNSIWYFDLFYSSVPYLNSTKSVKETLFMLNESTFLPPIQHHDVALFSYAERYLNSCVKPKLDNSKIELLMGDINRNKSRITELILKDDSIWANHVRISK